MCAISKPFISRFTFLLAITSPFITHALPLKLSLEEMVKLADTIVVAKAIKVDPISHKTDQKTPASYRVILHTIEVIKGSVEREVEVFYSDEWSFEATLRPDVTYLLFLKKRGPEFHVVQGYGGRIVIESHLAKGIFMDKETGTQDAEKFIKRVKAIKQ